jgi:hypothetical protein
MNTKRQTVAVATMVAAVALIFGVAAVPEARQAVKIAFADGRVTLVAEDALVSDVLAEWARAGKTEIIGAELLEKRVVTVSLDDVSEGEAIEAILGKAFGYVEMATSVEPGLSSIRRLVLAGAKTDEKPADPSTPPETRYSYFAGERVLAAEDFGKPEYTVLKELPPAPETMFNFFVPEKAFSDYTKPVFETFDPRWVIPEQRFEYFLKDFPKFEVDLTYVRTPTGYPEVRFHYFCGPKAGPC